MTKRKNKYENASKQKSLLGLGNTESLLAKTDYKKSLAETGRDIIVGGIGGGLMGTIMGRYSFITGILVTGIGHAINSPAASGFGIGLMASGGFQGSSSVNGTMSGMDGVKERLAHYKETIKKQFFIDKIKNMKGKKSEEESTNGVGNVQYFNHPNSELTGNEELNFTEANKLHDQLEQSAEQFERKQMSGYNDDINGLDGDVTERLM